MIASKIRSMHDVLGRLAELLGSGRLTEAQEKHFTYLEQQARHAQKLRMGYRRTRRHMVQRSRRANRRG